MADEEGRSLLEPPDPAYPQRDRGPLEVPTWRLLLYIVIAIALLLLLEKTGVFGV